MLKIPEGVFRAYLFDCDGTIADTMPVHYKAWSKALSKWECPFSEELFYAWGGVPVSKIISQLNDKHGLAMPLEAVMRDREEAYFEHLPTIQAVESVAEQIRLQHGKMKFAVVSGSPRESVRRTLAALDLERYFEVFVCAEDYMHGKPHPEPFLTAAARLGVDPSACLVFEDAPAGIESAKAAGMAWVRVPA